jgi:hypothetical protein
MSGAAAMISRRCAALTKSPASLKNGSRALVEVLPDAELREVQGTHNFKVNGAGGFLRPVRVRPACRPPVESARWRAGMTYAA